MPYIVPHDEQDALDALYSAVERLAKHGCDLPYIQEEAANAYRPFETKEEGRT